MVRRRSIVTWVALMGNLAASNGYASCLSTSETVVRGRFVRCENAEFYLEASGAYSVYERALEEALDRIDPRRHEDFLERIGGSFFPSKEARVIVVMVDWHVPIVPWLSGISETVEFQDQPRRFPTSVRYWWNGSIEGCEGIESAAPIDLWVRFPCCDTIPGSPECIVSMSYAEPAPDAMSDAVSSVLSD